MPWANKTDLAAPSTRYYMGFYAGLQDATAGRPARQIVPGWCTHPGEIGTHQGEYMIGYFTAYGGYQQQADAQANPRDAWLAFIARLSPAKRDEMVQIEFDHRLGGLCQCLSRTQPTVDDIADARAQVERDWGDLAAGFAFQVTP